MNYPEIDILSDLIQAHKISIETGTDSIENLKEIILKIDNQKFQLFIDDEYQDLTIPSPELHLCLVLFHLEDYNDSSDYLEWGRVKGLDTSNEKFRQYYISLKLIVPEIHHLLKIKSCPINHLNFELSSGAIGILRRTGK